VSATESILQSSADDPAGVSLIGAPRRDYAAIAYYTSLILAGSKVDYAFMVVLLALLAKQDIDTLIAIAYVMIAPSRVTAGVKRCHLDYVPYKAG
jgi:hypothetical protein